jgi:hypothetical protein
VLLRESWNASASAALFGSYEFARNYQSGEAEGEGRARVHTSELGWRLERRLIPRRESAFQVQGGVAHVSTFSVSGAPALTRLQPVGSATIQKNFAGGWTSLLTGGREVSSLNGLTSEPFVTTQAEARLSGTVARRLGIGLSGSYSRGESTSDTAGSFEGSSASARLQYGLARWGGMFASYDYYQHVTLEIPVALPSFTPTYEGHVWRVGLTMWLPLYGTF